MIRDLTENQSGQTPSAGVFVWLFIVATLFMYLCHIAAGFMIPLVVAIFIWYLINAIARFLGSFKRLPFGRMPRWLRLGLAMAFLSSIIVIIFELVHRNIGDVMAAAPMFQASLEKIIAQVAGFMGLDHAPQARELWSDLVGKYLNIGQLVRDFAGLLTGLAGKTLVTLVFVGFLLYEQRFLRHKMQSMFKDPESEERLHHTLGVIDVKIQRYIGVKAFVSFLDSVLTYLILSFFDVQFAEFWGVMAFFLHFIPYAGSFVALTLPSLIALIQFGDLGTVAMVLASLSISHAFLGHVLDPYMMGNNLNLSPIFIISNLAMWGLVWGIPGMFLAIPILAIVTIALEQFPTTRPIAILLSKTGVLSAPFKQPLAAILKTRRKKS
jgi:predicted PurR-regulated permease PerM